MRAALYLSMIATLAAGTAEAQERPLARAARTALARTGQAVGFTLGFVVTGALAVSKKWNAPLEGEGGPVVIQKGNHTFVLKQRHQPVVGPRILAKAQAMRPGSLRQAFVAGVGVGASQAPQVEGAFEAALARAINRLTSH